MPNFNQGKIHLTPQAIDFVIWRRDGLKKKVEEKKK